MTPFHYRAINKQGKTVSGFIEASSKRTALAQIKQKGFYPVAINEKKKTKTSKKNEPRSKEKVTLDLIKKIAQLHNGGLPVGDTIHLLSQRLSDKNQQTLASQLWGELSEGKPLAEAMKTAPQYFDLAVIQLVEAGEATGNLKPILKNIIELLEERRALKRKISNALAYPTVVMVVAIIVASVFLFVLLPQIQEMMASMGGELSLAARISIGISQFAITQGPFLLIASVIGLILFWRWQSTPGGKKKWDRWILKIPILKTIIWNINLCRTANVLSTLLESGINTTETLKLTEKAIGNSELRHRFQLIRQQVNDGVSLARSMRVHKFLTDLEADILEVGENTGSLTSGFREIYDSRANDLDNGIKLLSNLLATGALLFSLGMVIILALGITTSILNLSQQLLSR